MVVKLVELDEVMWGRQRKRRGQGRAGQGRAGPAPAVLIIFTHVPERVFMGMLVCKRFHKVLQHAERIHVDIPKNPQQQDFGQNSESEWEKREHWHHGAGSKLFPNSLLPSSSCTISFSLAPLPFLSSLSGISSLTISLLSPAPMAYLNLLLMHAPASLRRTQLTLARSARSLSSSISLAGAWTRFGRQDSTG
eukprot:756594-Hanusia_phi.AAC.1